MEQTLSRAILYVSPEYHDQASLRRILHDAIRVIPAATCRQALRCLTRVHVPVVLCDCALPDGSWLDLLHRLDGGHDSPVLIVSSSTADEYLWAEVLNLGGFDVIAKPFRAAEVLHVLETARGHRSRAAAPGFRNQPANGETADFSRRT